MSTNYRITTNGMMRNYRGNLYKSNNTLNKAMEKVQTRRQFLSYAEDPAAASKAWQLRRAYWRTNDQIDNCNNIISRNRSAWSALDMVVDEVEGLDAEYGTALEGITGTAAASRKPLGQAMLSTADAIVQNMNSRYEEDFLFAAADGLNVPFSWSEDGKLLYREIDVDTPNPIQDQAEFDAALAAGSKTTLGAADFTEYADKFKEKYGITTADAAENYKKLKSFTEETTYVDIGLGLREDKDGKIISSSAYDSALCGLTFLGYGVDEDGDKLNLVSIMRELGELFHNCDPDTGEYPNGEVDEERANQLTRKFYAALGVTSERHVELSAKTDYLEDNVGVLEDSMDTLTQQVSDLEDIEPADAITQMVWANYCYQAALKIGTNILSQSLIDYMR